MAEGEQSSEEVRRDNSDCARTTIAPTQTHRIVKEGAGMKIEPSVRAPSRKKKGRVVAKAAEQSVQRCQQQALHRSDKREG
jgi:hypothetical protein